MLPHTLLIFRMKELFVCGPICWQVEADVMSFLDTNMDGKLDQSDLQDWAKNAVDVLVTDTKLSAG